MVEQRTLASDGEFGSALTFEIARITYDLTATSGIFYNPSNLPIRSDNDRFFYAQNFAIISDNQLALNATPTSLTPTVVDSGTAYTVTLDAATSITFQKGMTSTGGSIRLGGVDTALRTSVQTMSVSATGPAWAP